MPLLNIFRYQETIEFAPGEPTPYARKAIKVVLTGTTTAAPIYSDADLTQLIANSRIITDEDSEVEFWSPEASVDILRERGGARTHHVGDPGGSDEVRYTRFYAMR